MKYKSTLRKAAELSIGLTAIASLVLAGCGGSSGIASTTPLNIVPALGQVYGGQITVIGSNGTTRSYPVQSGVASVTADISGMTAPLLIALSGDASNTLTYFDEAQAKIVSSVAPPASAVRAIVPSVIGLPASGVGVTPLTEVAAATVANPKTGAVDITSLSVASAVGANTAGLSLFQKLSGSTTVKDVLAAPTPVSSMATTLGASDADLYAKVLHTLARLPSATYGADAFAKTRKMADSVAQSGGLPATFNTDAGVAVAAVKQATPAAWAATFTPQTAFNADFKAMMNIAAQALPASAVNVSQQNAALNAVMDGAFNAVSSVTGSPATNPVALAAIQQAITSSKSQAGAALMALFSAAQSSATSTATAGGGTKPQAAISLTCPTPTIGHTPSAAEIASFARTYTGSTGWYFPQPPITPISIVISSTGTLTGGGATLNINSFCVDNAKSNLANLTWDNGMGSGSFMTDGNFFADLSGPFAGSLGWAGVTGSGGGTAGGTAIGGTGTTGGGTGGTMTVGGGRTPKFAYVANSRGGVSAYTINGTTGALTAITGSPFSAGPAPQSVTVDPSGKFAYVASGGGVSAYTINGTTGALTAITGSPFPAGTFPWSVTVDPSGKFAYIANTGGGVSAYTINGTTGALTAITGSPFTAGTNPKSVTVDPSGKFAYVASYGSFQGSFNVIGNVSTYTINGTTGALTAVTGSPFTAGPFPQSVTVDPSGKFAYVANSSGGVSAYTINGTTGALTEITGSPFTAGTGPLSVTVDPSGKFAYVANTNSYNVSAYTINGTTGALTEITGSPFTTGVMGLGPQSVTVDPSGKFAYVANKASDTVSVFTINGTTGALTEITGSPFPAGLGPTSVTVW